MSLRRWCVGTTFVLLGLGSSFGCAGRRGATAETPTTNESGSSEASLPTPRTEPEPSRPSFLLRGAKVMTAAGVVYERADVQVNNGKITAVGPSLPDPPADVPVIDVTGKVVTPGIIDTHSHMGVYASPGLKAHSDGNEAVSPNTAYVHAADGYWPQDPQFDTARAGGITTAMILPGSANLIGGRTFTVKLHPGARSAKEARFPGAPEGLKMACGENPKRVYGEKGGPQTRMGNVAGHRRAFQEGFEYKKAHDRYEQKLADWKAGKGKGESPPDPPGRDFAKETIAKVIDGEILVHNHCYRADEMLIMMDLAAEYGFSIRSFHHAIEGYKIVDELVAHDTAISTWADWWGFKAEAYDGVRENAAMLAAAGGRAIIHSDDAIGIQRLNQEAAKAMFAGRRAGLDVSEDEALRWITLNPAWALGIHEQTGSIEAGKMADLVVWNGTPFSVYAKAEQVYIDGELVYDRHDPEQQPRTDFDLGTREGDLEEGSH